MSISSIAPAGSAAGSTGGNSDVRRLEAEKQVLQQNLQRLRRKTPDKKTQAQEKELERKIAKIEQQILQAQSGSSAAARAGQAQGAASAVPGSSGRLDVLA